MNRVQDGICSQIVGYFENSIVGQRQHGSYRSWEHCFAFFHGQVPLDPDLASLHLGFYLASWGMYRGSAAIRNYDYLIHKPAVDIILQYNSPDFDSINQFSEGSIDRIYEVYEEISSYYCDKIGKLDTLVTKILLGTLGCTPAYDKYFTGGLKKLSLPASFTRDHFACIIAYCRQNGGISEAQNELSKAGFNYPIMRVFDIYCHSLTRGEPHSAYPVLSYPSMT